MANRVAARFILAVLVVPIAAGCSSAAKVDATNSTAQARDRVVGKGSTSNADESPDRPTKQSYK